MHESGELAKLLGDIAAPAVTSTATVTVTPSAAAALRAALDDGNAGDVVHLAIDAQFEHTLDLGPREPGAVTMTVSGIVIEMDAMSASRASGVSIDFVTIGGGGFRIDNPNRPAHVKQLTPTELRDMMQSGSIQEVYDVRTPREREVATIAGAKLLDDAAKAQIETLPKDTAIAFHCHHGGRSQTAAEFFLSKGFRRLYNLAGGIDAWSQQIDPKVPRY
jgi:monothiol glutaredoxin